MEEHTHAVETEAPSPKEHSEFAPSSMARVEACPASWRQCRAIPNPETDAMREGTAKHAMVAILMTGVPVDKVEHQDVQDCLDFASTLVGEGRCTVDTERRVSYRTFAGELYFGTADLVVTSPEGHVTIVDWKFGRNPVAAPGNMQLAMYAVAIVQEMRRSGQKVGRVSACIFQPNVSVQPAFWEDIDVDAQEERIRLAINSALEEDAPMNPGSHCLMCPAYAAATCPAIHSCAVAIGRAVSRHSDPLCVDDIAAASEEQLAAWMDAADLADKFISALRDEVRSRALAHSGKYAGWKIQRAKGRLSIDDPMGLYEAMRQEFGTDQNAFIGCGSFSASKLSRLAGGSNADGRKRSRENQAMELCEAYGNRGEDTVKLVREEMK